MSKAVFPRQNMSHARQCQLLVYSIARCPDELRLFTTPGVTNCVVTTILNRFKIQRHTTLPWSPSIGPHRASVTFTRPRQGSRSRSTATITPLSALSVAIPPTSCHKHLSIHVENIALLIQYLSDDRTSTQTPGILT